MDRFELSLAVLGVLVCSYLIFNHIRKTEDDAHAASVAAQTNAMRLLQNDLAEAASTRKRLEVQLRSGFENLTAALVEDQKAQAEDIDDLKRLSAELVHSRGESLRAFGQSRKELEERVDRKMLEAVSTLREELGKYDASLSSVKLSSDNMAVTIADLQERYGSVKEEVSQAQGVVLADIDSEPSGELREPGQQWPLQQPAAVEVIMSPPPPQLSSYQQQVLGAVDVITPAAAAAMQARSQCASREDKSQFKGRVTGAQRRACCSCRISYNISSCLTAACVCQIFQWFYNTPQPKSPEPPGPNPS